MIEYRICWNASSNSSFRGATEWFEWWGEDEATADEVQDSLSVGGDVPQGLGEALEASGFDWWSEVRKVDR